MKGLQILLATQFNAKFHVNKKIYFAVIRLLKIRFCFNLITQLKGQVKGFNLT